METTEVKLEVPLYDTKSGLQYRWEDGFIINVRSSVNGITIQANRAGLRSLAIQLLNLSQDSVPNNYHIHLDEQNSLEDNSLDLIIEKAN